MRRIKLLGLAAISILAFTIAAGTAQATENPILEQLPAGLKFSFKSTAGENTVLLTLSGKKIECVSVTGAALGKIPLPTEEKNSKRLGLIEFKFVNCKVAILGTKCTGLADATEGNITVKAEYHIRHLLSPEEAFVNLAILVPAAAHFSCLGVLFVVKGCVASMDLLTKANGANVVNLLLATMFVDFLQEKGEQKPLTIDTDNSLGMENCDLFSKEGAAAEETAGQLGSGTIENCKTEAEAECTFLIDLSGTQ